MQIAVLGAKYGKIDIYDLPPFIKTADQAQLYAVVHILTSDDTYVVAETITISDHRKSN